MSARKPPKDFDQYVKAFPRPVQAILRTIRATVRDAAPEAEERISYRMPAFFLDGALVYFAAFEQHIGMYPPVQGNHKLQQALARYRGEKGNLKFPLDEPIPYGLIKRAVKAKIMENRALRETKQRKR